MKLTRDGWLGISVLLMLIVVTVAAVLLQSQAPVIPYLSTSSDPSGTLALKLWLKELGYPSAESSQTAFEFPQNVKTIFIIQPILAVSEKEWKFIDQWLETGGMVVIAGDTPQSFDAMDHFDFSAAYLKNKAVELLAAAPILSSPSFASKVAIETNFTLKTTRTDFTPLLSADGSPVIVSFEQGKGRVVLSSTPYLFSNLALKDDTVAALTLNILALAGQKGMVWFDEWHHGFQTGSIIIGPGQWLRHTSGGHALLFVVGVVFLALLLQGRAFGRPIPLLHEIKRRGPLEHVTAIANLNRKAGHRNEVLKQYHQRVKRHLGQRYRLDPSLDDAEYSRLFSQYNSSINKDDLLNLLNRLSQKNVSEGELLKLATEAAHWIKE
ncbi:MAG: DUF4350 domain-containing protein [Chloroflexi bacterium]|nr:DUF4350 domain-containing protein [Chloroflexota bacterium]